MISVFIILMMAFAAFGVYSIINGTTEYSAVVLIILCLSFAATATIHSVNDYAEMEKLKEEKSAIESATKLTKTYQVHNDTAYFISTKGDTLIHVKERLEELK